MFLRKCKSSIRIFNYLVVLFSLLFSSQGYGQQLPGQQIPQTPEYTDAELILFINAVEKVMPLQQESQIKMIEKIEEENLTVEKFNDIMNSHSTGEAPDATKEELEAFNKCIEGIQEIQYEYEPMIIKALENEGITPEKYHEIIVNYQYDKVLQMRVNNLMDNMEDE